MTRKTTRLPFLTAVISVIFCLMPLANADSSGRAGYSGKTAGRICTSCHSTNAGTTATLTGPTSVASGSTNTYTVTIKGPGTTGGVDVASTAGTFTAGTGSKILSGELVHSSPSATKSWTFSWIAPTVTANTATTLYAAGVDSYNGGTGTTTMAISVTASAPLPTLAVSPTSLAFSSITGGATPAAQTFAVSSSGAALTYTVATSGGTWLSATGGGTTPSNVSVSVNPAGLAAGTYTGTVSVTSSGASNSPRSVGVTLTVTSAPNLTVSPASLTFAYTTGGSAPASQTVAVGSSGGALPYTVAASGGAWLSASGGGTTPGNVSVSVNPSGLAAGTYTGTVAITATGAANSPQNVAVTLTVSNASLTVSPASLSFIYTTGGTTPAAQSVAVTSSGGVALSYTVTTSGSSWLSAGAGGTTPGSVSVSVNPSGLAAGTYTGTVTVTSAGASNSPQNVAVTFTVTSSPALVVSPASLAFAYTTGSTAPAAQTFAVSSSGSALTFTVASSGGTWLSASGGGTTPGNVSVSINTAGLTAGTYTGSVSVTATGAANSPQSVAVTLTVTGAPNLSVSPASLSFSFITGGTAPASQSFAVSSSSTALTYTISTSGGTWLSASGAGTTPGNVTVSIKTTGLAAGTYNGTVSVAASGAGNSPQSVAVTLTVTNPPNLTVSPASLAFSYAIGDMAPAAQTISVGSSGAALSYTVASSGGTWLSATGGGMTPGSASVSVNPGTLAAGTYTGTVSVSAAGSGNSPQTVAVTLTVTNAPDTIPPSISIHSPQPLAVLAGIIQLTATASDDVGVVGVSYQVDGKQVGSEQGTAPYSVTWDSGAVSNGIHLIIATARDAAGNTSVDSINVQVSNAGMSSGGLLGTMLDSNTKFQVQQNGISTLFSCVTCWFAGPSDLLPGQVLEVRLRAGASPSAADVVILKQQTIDGSITQVGTNQFTLQPSASYLPATVVVITGSATNLNGLTPQVGQQIAVRGILLKNSPSGGPTLIATIVELQ
ncbi:MAG: hypothetical protein DMG60_04840 [Acidobacteria bacterium]|nr:MAG: hypothetical protein DMG60_04840 [Acidobacteriota bacterium]